MERVGFDDHPLSLSPTKNATHRSNISLSRQAACSPAASLIQSAARSVLDDLKASSNDGRATISPSSSPALQSLQIETLPAIPDEQDRRRFIGCLAAILFYAFDYDEPDNDSSKTKNGTGSFSQENTSDIFYDAEDEDEHIVHPITAISHSQLEVRVSSDNFVEMEKGTSQTFKSRARQSCPNPSHRNFHHNISNNRPRWRQSSAEKIKISKQRHRRRRYDFLCQFLVASSELLFLDKSVAKAFLPMLSRILVPESKDPIPLDRTKNGKETNALDRVQSNEIDMSASDFPQSLSTSGSGNVLHNQVRKVDTTKGTAYEATKPTKAYIPEEIDRDNVLKPFLESLTPGAGFRCLSLLMLQHLLTSEAGYDARTRHVLKKLGCVVLAHDMARDPVERESPTGHKVDSLTYQELAKRAARKFESLEHSMARRLIRLSESSNEKSSKIARGIDDTGRSKATGITREQILRGMKIGSAGIVAGTLFAVTGGLAAPGKCQSRNSFNC